MFYLFRGGLFPAACQENPATTQQRTIAVPSSLRYFFTGTALAVASVQMALLEC